MNISITVTKLDATSCTFAVDLSKSTEHIHCAVERHLGVPARLQKLVLTSTGNEPGAKRQKCGAGVAEQIAPVLKLNWKDESERMDVTSLKGGAEFACIELPTLNNTSMEHFDDREAYKAVALSVLEQTNSCAELANLQGDLLEDRDVIRAACRHRSPAEDERPVFHYVADDSALRWDREVVLDAIRGGWADELFNVGREQDAPPPAIKSDREIMKAAIASMADSEPSEFGNSMLAFASEELKSDREFVRWAVVEQGCLLPDASDLLIAELAQERADGDGDGDGNDDLLLASMRQRGVDFHLLVDQVPALASDRDLVLAAVQSDDEFGTGAFKYAAAELRADREVVLAAVRRAGKGLSFASDEMREDREVALAAVREAVAAAKQYQMDTGEVLDYMCGEDGDEFVNGQTTKDYVRSMILTEE